MKPELQRIFDATPEDGPRSKLEPFCELIFAWRQQKRSYRRISQLLGEHCHVTVTPSALHDFVKRRTKRWTVEMKFAEHPPSVRIQ